MGPLRRSASARAATSDERGVRNRCAIVAIALLFALMACTAAAHAEPPQTIERTESASVDGWNIAVDVYAPAMPSIQGVAIIAHGFARDRSRHRVLAEDLAAAGIVAIVPDLPHVMDHWGNGAALAELANALAAGALGLPPVERSRLVLIGTSAGGLATVVAAAKLPGLAGWIGLDPVDRTGTGARAAEKLTAPAVVLLGGGSQCNLFGSGRSIARAAPRLLRSTKIKDASHCDFEEPTNKFCELMCGAASSSMQARIRDETVDAALEMLRGPAGAP